MLALIRKPKIHKFQAVGYFDKISAWQLIYKTGWILNKEIQPIYTSWVKDKADSLINDALDGLKLINKPQISRIRYSGQITEMCNSYLEELKSAQ